MRHPAITPVALKIYRAYLNSLHYDAYRPVYLPLWILQLP